MSLPSSATEASTAHVTTPGVHGVQASVVSPPDLHVTALNRHAGHPHVDDPSLRTVAEEAKSADVEETATDVGQASTGARTAPSSLVRHPTTGSAHHPVGTTGIVRITPSMIGADLVHVLHHVPSTTVVHGPT